MIIRWLSFLTLLVAIPSASAAPFFMLLGRLPGLSSSQKFLSKANDVSNDGKVVVGQAYSVRGSEAFRWTRTTGLVGLGDDPNGSFYSSASAVSGNGKVIVGNGTTGVSAGTTGFRWTEATGRQNLPYINNSVSQPFFNPVEVSEDGRIIGGGGIISTGNVGALYTVEDGFTTVGHLMARDAGGTSGMSGDGRVLIGSSGDNGPTIRAYRWTAQDGIQMINGSPGRTATAATAISTDGRVIAGLQSGSAFLWTEGVGTEDLGLIPGTNVSFAPFGANGDGSILVGHTGNSGGFSGLYAVWWDRARGARYLQDVATQDYGINLGDWRLASATAISPNGQWIVGAADNSLGYREAFLLHVPEASSFSFLSIVALSLLGFRSIKSVLLRRMLAGSKATIMV